MAPLWTSTSSRQDRLSDPSCAGTCSRHMSGTAFEDVELSGASRSSSKDGSTSRMTRVKIYCESHLEGFSNEGIDAMASIVATRKVGASLQRELDEAQATILQLEASRKAPKVECKQLKEHAKAQDEEQAAANLAHMLRITGLELEVDQLKAKLAAKDAEAQANVDVVASDFLGLMITAIEARDAKIAEAQVHLADISIEVEARAAENARLLQALLAASATCASPAAAARSDEVEALCDSNSADEDDVCEAGSEASADEEADAVDGRAGDERGAEPEACSDAAALRSCLMGMVHNHADRIVCGLMGITPAQQLPTAPTPDNGAQRMPLGGVYLGDPAANSVLSMEDGGPATAAVDGGAAAAASSVGRKAIVLKRMPFDCTDSDGSFLRARSEVATYLGFSREPRFAARLPRALQVCVAEATADERGAGCSHALVMVMEAARGNLRECLAGFVEEQRASGVRNGDWVLRLVARYAGGMLEVVRDVHEAGWLMDDVKPVQFVEMADGSVGAIDLEAWRPACEQLPGVGPCALGANVCTEGFAAPERYGASSLALFTRFSCAASDVYAVGRSVEQLLELAEDLAGQDWEDWGLGASACAPLLRAFVEQATKDKPLDRMSVQ